MEPQIVQNWLIQNVGLRTDEETGMIPYALGAVRYLGTEEQAIVPTECNGEPITLLGGAGPVFDELHDPRILIVPEGIEQVGAEAMLDSAVEEIVFSQSCREFGNRAFANCTRLHKLKLPVTGCVTLGKGVFAGCTALESLRLPAGCLRLPAQTFAGCSSLKKVQMPAVCFSVGEQAFAGCSSLPGLRLPSSCRYVFGRAFEGCFAMKELLHGDDTFVSNAAFGETEDPENLHTAESFTFRRRKDQSLEITGYTGADTVVEIPAEIDGAPITRIAAGVFSGRGHGSSAPLLRVILPQWIEEIGAAAFAGCDLLASVQLPRRLNRLEERAFESCRALHTLNLPRLLQVIESRCFADCTALENVTLPSHLAELGWEAFAGCTALTTLPQGLRSLPKGCFEGCTGLKEITLAGNLTEYGPYAFANCTALQRVVLEEGCPALPEGMFAGCTALQEICLSGKRPND